MLRPTTQRLASLGRNVFDVHPELGELGRQHIAAAAGFGSGFAGGSDGFGAFGSCGFHQLYLSGGFGRNFPVAGDQLGVCNGWSHMISRSMRAPIVMAKRQGRCGGGAARRPTDAGRFEGMMADIETNGGM